MFTKVGIDIHGVIDRYPKYFRDLSHKLFAQGNEIHIITGQPWESICKLVNGYEIKYTHHYSIVDHHKVLGTKMWQDEKKTWWMSPEDWNRSKGDYICQQEIDIHFDNNWEYVDWMPNTCTTIMVSRFRFDTTMAALTLDLSDKLL